jgi:hypothetical protein
MELTNLIWHLGAAIAAVWAAFAYRGLSARYAELKDSVLVSVLPLHPSASGEGGEVKLPELNERARRIRALRWVLAEFRSAHGVVVVFEGQDNLLRLEQAQWVSVVSELVRCVQGSMRLSQTLNWLDQSGNGISAQMFIQKLVECGRRGQKMTLQWNAAACAGQGGWQWRIS